MLNECIFFGEVVLDDEILFVREAVVDGIHPFEMRGLVLLAVDGLRIATIHR
jgi:hypothetical protein